MSDNTASTVAPVVAINPVVAETVAVAAPAKGTVAWAREIASLAISKTVQHHGLSQAEAQAYLDRLPGVPVVALAFDLSVRALWLALENLSAKAGENAAKIRKSSEWTNKIQPEMGEWMEGVLAEAEKFLATVKYESALPEVGKEFVAQSLDPATRGKMQDMILDLEDITFAGHCRVEGCTELAQWNSREGRFHPNCKTHYEAKLAEIKAAKDAEKAAEAARPARTWIQMPDGSFVEKVQVAAKAAPKTDDSSEFAKSAKKALRYGGSVNEDDQYVSKSEMTKKQADRHSGRQGRR